MPKRVEPVAALAVRRWAEQRPEPQKNGKPRLRMHAVGGVAGLHLQVGSNGAASWILRVKVGARRRDIGLGSFPTVTLAQARDKARAAREKIEAGIDPVAERRARRLALG